MSLIEVSTPPTWSELRQTVRDVRSHFSNRGLRTPSCLTFRKTGGRTRLYFLSEPASKRDTSLLYVDLPPTVGQAHSPQWCPLIEAGFQVIPGPVSKEEQLLWERKKCASWGITSYDLDPTSGRIIFPAGGSLFFCADPATGHTGPLFPYEIQTKTTGARLNATMCPHNPELIAFVNNADIWVTHLVSRCEQRLTFCHNASAGGVADDPLSAGLPCYVMQEEFNRFTGFWWQPRTPGRDNIYTLLYEEVDESAVEIVRILGFPSTTPDLRPDVEEFRYPRADMPNATSTLRLLRFTLSASQEIIDVVHYDLITSLTTVFPWVEYLVRVGWTEDGKHVWAQVLDRSQQRLEMILIPESQFVRSSLPKLGSGIEKNGPEHTEVSPIQVIMSEQSEWWVSVHDILKFLPHPDPTQLKFLWASEETGYRHLYLVTASIVTSSYENSSPDSVLCPRIVSKIPLTSGDWEVVNRQIWWDEVHKMVYFHGLRDSCLERHLYCVSTNRPGEVRRLTAPGFSHSVEMGPDCLMMTTVFSSVNTLPGCQVFAITHSDNTVDGVSLNSNGWILQPTNPDKEFPPPELFSHCLASGHKLYGMIYKPHNHVPGVRYPVVLNVYGGPELQLVSNSFKGLRELRSHLLASQGYAVVCVDNRGSLHRGAAWEAWLRGRLGQVELTDQVEVLHWLSSVTGYLDLSRVAIHGWSYGGYLSLMGLVQYPSEFKLAVAGAPVTSWQLYDTGYTERYLDRPSSKPNGYKLGSILNFVGQLPDEEGRLLIMHGTMDENVHFMQHSAQLINLLIKHGKPYQLQIYPGERHSLRHPDSNEHYLTSLLSFLKKNL